MDPLIGTTLGSYQVLSEIGRGGMGVVYRGYQPSLNRSVAIKVLAAHMAHDKVLVERFLHEARFTAGLSHPNIVTIHEVSTAPPYHFVMEYIEGETLTQYLQREHVIPPARAAEIISRVADALDYAHSRGIIHRDIKPANIMLTPTGRVILTDFGIARATEGTRLTRDASALGTPEYMSPEMIEGEPANASSDLYALGVVLYEMVTGRVPFHGDTPLATLHQQIHQNLPPPRQINSRLSPEVERVLLKALAKEPRKRFSSAREMAQVFTAATMGKGMPLEIPRHVLGIGCAFLIILMVLGAFVSGIIRLPGSTPTPAPVMAEPSPTRNIALVSIPTTVEPTQTPFVITATTQPTLPPTQTLVPTSTLVPSETPMPTNVAPTITPTRRVIRPTETETPTEIPPPTETPLPRGVWVMGLDTVPPHSADRAQMYFVAKFLNTTDGEAYFNWCVEIFVQGDTSHAFSNTECKPGTIRAGASELRTPGYNTGCGAYQVRVIWIDTFNVRHVITTPDGSTAWGSFTVCP